MEKKFTVTGQPWIPYAAITFLYSIIRPGWRVFEWGSGNSTYFFAREGMKLISIEHDFDWYREVRAVLDSRFGSTNPRIQLHYIPMDVENIGCDKSNPDHYYEPPYAGNFQQYAKAIEQYDQFDLIMVDGTSRPSCLVRAADKVRDGGYIILDNSDRKYYLAQSPHLFDKWERYSFFGRGPENTYMWECTFYRKPGISL